jgi:hypothetical protein
VLSERSLALVVTDTATPRRSRLAYAVTFARMFDHFSRTPDFVRQA